MWFIEQINQIVILASINKKNPSIIRDGKQSLLKGGHGNRYRILWWGRDWIPIRTNAGLQPRAEWESVDGKLIRGNIKDKGLLVSDLIGLLQKVIRELL